MTGEALLEIVKTRLAEARPIRRTLPDGGRLHIDRPVPFLCVYRKVEHDPGTADLVRTQASYLIAHEPAQLAGPIAAVLADVCGGCLVIELFAGGDASAPYRIHTTQQDRFATTIETLCSALEKAEVVADTRTPTTPGVLEIRLEVPPVYRSANSIYPAMLRALAHDLAHALQKTFFEFTRVQTPARPEHFHMMGRRRIVRAVRESDRALAQLDESFDFLLAITPINTDAAWREFCDSGYTCTPTFHYRMLEVDPEIGKRRLYELPIEQLEDPVLAQLLRDKRREIDRRLGMLDDRDTPRFRYASMQLYGTVEDELFAEAEAILAALPARDLVKDARRVTAEAFAQRARDEIARYPLRATVEVRADVASLIVSSGNLLVPAKLDVAESRVGALLAHEVGTHAVTYANGRAQPLHVLATGLAGYEALQEGLAMFAEYMAGGLDAERLRLLAARVVAVRRVEEDAAFPDVVRELVERCALSPRGAFGVAMRVFRGGGLTKDAIYLRGLRALLGYLKTGGVLEPLIAGKIAFDQIALVEELLHREVLRAPALRPRWLDEGSPRLARARAGMTPIELVEEPV